MRQELVQIPRILEVDPANRLVAITEMILSVPSVSEVEALVIWPSVDVTRRETRHAVRNWNRSPKGHLLIAGYHIPEVAEREYGRENFCGHFGLERVDNLHTQVHARNAKEQAEWVAEKVKELGIKSIALYVPPFHLVRAYLTQLKSLFDRGIMIPIIPMPTPFSPGQVLNLPSPAEVNEANQWDLVAGEVKRILQYQEKEDLVRFFQLEAYIDWLWKQPILQKEVVA